MKKSSVLFVLMAASGICFSSVYAQKRLVLDLNQTIALANDSSSHSAHKICICPVIGNTGRTGQTVCRV